MRSGLDAKSTRRRTVLAEAVMERHCLDLSAKELKVLQDEDESCFFSEDVRGSGVPRY